MSRHLLAITAAALLVAPVALAKNDEETWTFVSIPDHLNVDLGDISGLPTYDGGPNSTSPSWESTIAYMLDEVAALAPEVVLVAGDIVMGRWDQDIENRGIFGAPTSFAGEQARIDAAADHYYSLWKARFDSRGLDFLVALGDHEIGDDPWSPGSNKAALVPTFKAAFGRHFTQGGGVVRAVGTGFADSAYFKQVRNVLIVAVDVFKQNPDGSVSITVDGTQLAWLDAVLNTQTAGAGIDHVIVMGHAPVLVPVRFRTTSGLVVEGAEGSAFWQTLVARGVDLYLAGEMHAMTAANQGGVEQVVHGGLAGFNPQLNFLVGTVSPDSIELELRQIDVINGGSSLWQTDFLRPAAQVEITPANRAAGFESVGTLTIEKSEDEKEFAGRTGFFQAAAVTNGGFETSLPGPGGTNTSLDDWTQDGSTGAILKTVAGVPAPPDGKLNWAFLDAGGSFWQNLGVIKSSHKYELRYDVGDRTTHATTPLTVELWAGASAPGSGGSVLLDSAQAQLPASNGGVQPNTTTFTIFDPQLSGVKLWLRFAAGAAPGQVLLDDVRLEMKEKSPQCGDEVDNDGDGFTDYPADPGCKSLDSDLEAPECQDGIDNDGRTGVDFDGGASALGGVPIDVPDPQCVNRPSRNSERGSAPCGLGFELLLLLPILAGLRRRR